MTDAQLAAVHEAARWAMRMVVAGAEDDPLMLFAISQRLVSALVVELDAAGYDAESIEGALEQGALAVWPMVQAPTVEQVGHG